jgi:hypothetical protein
VVSRQRSLVALGLFSGLALVGLALTAPTWVSWVGRVPALTAADATNIISTTPEFNRSYANLVVTSLDVGRSSMQGTCLTSVVFRINRTSDTVNGRAFFQYWEREWHLVTLYYGVPPNVTVVK